MMSLWSRVCKCFPSFKSQSIALQSLPPLAHREPSGDTVTVFKYPVCPEWLIFNRQFVRFQTLTMRSQPADTMIGLEWFGENLTHDTQSVWPSSWMVYLHSASVFHSLIVLSREPDTIWRLSTENATLNTSYIKII